MHVYFDGESHFIRSEQCAKEVFGEEFTLEAVAQKGKQKYEELTQNSGRTKLFQYLLVLVEPRCKFFWDSSTLAYSGLPGRDQKPVVASHMVYFSSCTGDEDTLHAVRVLLRDNNFEPQIVKERAQLAKQRENTLGNEGVIEKPKGVDISLAVRMLEDAQRNVFCECILFTSDVDYIPLIEAVQRMGKRVYVFGYRNGIGKNSAMEFVPDAFVDLAPCMTKRKEWLDHDYTASSKESAEKMKQISEMARQAHRWPLS